MRTTAGFVRVVSSPCVFRRISSKKRPWPSRELMLRESQAGARRGRYSPWPIFILASADGAPA